MTTRIFGFHVYTILIRSEKDMFSSNKTAEVQVRELEGRGRFSANQ